MQKREGQLTRRHDRWAKVAHTGVWSSMMCIELWPVHCAWTDKICTLVKKLGELLRFHLQPSGREQELMREFFTARLVSGHPYTCEDAIKASSLADNLTFVNTTVKQDKAIQGKTDIVIYQKREGHQENKQLTLSLDCAAIYTKLFNWAKDPNTLFEFIWRLNSLTFAQRGYDTTVTVLENDEGVGAAQSTLVVYKGIEKVEVEDLCQILINDDHAMDRQPKPYITSMRIWEMKNLLGWLTFRYICHDIEQNELDYLKDYWHTNFPGIEKEGDIYCKLQKVKVCYIPKLGPAGDMLSTPEHPLNVQSTRTQDYVKDGDHKCIWCPSTLLLRSD
ncbi:hypothetical protein F5148DRAFT_1152630 [Russula earlei]|uniref:Uncharacterized protein n=1 Tax=Russula earlei TaxID=71964 RepID=A0ACC0TVU0_9AGAM|nr:hypothetical protein F5148DRAFT_1152630 [Russula earlei]